MQAASEYMRCPAALRFPDPGVECFAPIIGCAIRQTRVRRSGRKQEQAPATKREPDRAKGVYQLASISHIEPEIEDGRAVGDPTDRDQIDSARRDRGDRFDRDPAGGFGYRAPSDHPHGAVEGFRVHIVE